MTQAQDPVKRTRKSSAKKATPRKKAAKKAAPKTAPTKKRAPKKTAPQKEATRANGAAPAAEAAAPEKQKALFEDFDSLSEYLVDVTGKSQEVVREFFVHHPELKVVRGERPADPLNVGEAFQEMMSGLSADPGTVMQRQFNLWGDYAKMMSAMSRRMAGEDVKPAIEPDPKDKRFAHDAWRENPMLDFVKQSYLTYANWRTVPL
ncbi:MAG: hypothetical protein AAGJ87_06050, partial [Pseudomonadota bacterium]